VSFDGFVVKNLFFFLQVVQAQFQTAEAEVEKVDNTSNAELTQEQGRLLYIVVFYLS
jgi:hypothetical protein